MTKLEKLVHLLRHSSSRRALFQGVAATVEHESVLVTFQPATVIDVGANRGQFTLLCRRLFPHARVFAFEPLETAADRFGRLFGDDQDVRLFRVAIGPTSEQRTMYVSRRNDSSSLLPITQDQERIFPGSGLEHTTKVRVSPIQELLSVSDLVRPILLKIDVQGFEVGVLKGCEQILADVEVLYIELSFREFYAGQSLAGNLLPRIGQAGFELRSIHNPVLLAGAVVQADFLFVREGPGSQDAPEDTCR